MMRFYTQQHRFYCGVDLHAKTMHVCIVDWAGKVLVHKNIPARPDAFLELIAPYREGLVVGVECMFAWYWLADLCATEKLAFVLGHALYMRAIHGGKSKSDKIDSEKIARLLRGGLIRTTPDDGDKSTTRRKSARLPLPTRNHEPNRSLRSKRRRGCPCPECHLTGDVPSGT